ncbi:MAG TPA: phosphoribosylamine--glycine ligase [Syntrophorhabdaceae bacterium]|jgi:phosphoribosylamine--glycine ligase
MKVLIIGSGAREHALAWKISQSPMVSAIFCAPGNGGISDVAECVNINAGDMDGLLRFSKQENIELVIVGPENPLAAGIVDLFEREGLTIFGPCMKGAQIEASKIFSKELMERNNIPTAPFKAFMDHSEALRYARSIAPPYVIKADGLCAGKGAYVIHDGGEGEKVLDDLMVRKVYGAAGENIIIEHFLPGVEASYLAFTDGKTILPMLPAQDHKPLLDGDRGPNTGGMGAYTPIPFIEAALEAEIKKEIMERTIGGMAEEGIQYKGVLYGGLMLQNNHPYVIEFNARLGDPETQPILFKMESDIVPILIASATGGLDSVSPISWKPGVSICVVIASGGYPENPEKGKIIRGLEGLRGHDKVTVFHAGTRKEGGSYYTSGGRVLGITAIGDTYKDAVRNVYDAISSIEFEGMQYRKDIGGKAIKFIEERGV